MLLLVPAILAAFGLYSGRDALVWLAIGIFLWLSWNRQKEQRRTRLISVPMPTDVKVPEFGGGSGGSSSAIVGPGCGPRCGGCA